MNTRTYIMIVKNTLVSYEFDSWLASYIKKFREINFQVFSTKFHCKLFSRDIFKCVRVKSSFFHTVLCSHERYLEKAALISHNVLSMELFLHNCYSAVEWDVIPSLSVRWRCQFHSIDKYFKWKVHWTYLSKWILAQNCIFTFVNPASFFQLFYSTTYNF